MQLAFKKKTAGFSLIELLISTAIVVILVIGALLLFSSQLSKGRDGRRKTDIQKITTAFEEYHSDFGCYPPDTILDVCGGTELQPYMPAVPCDPQKNTKYYYAPESAACPSYYRIFTQLERTDDPESLNLGCTAESGCGAADYFPELGEDATKLNYGDSEGVQFYGRSGVVNPPPNSGTPTPTPVVSRYCCPGGQGSQCNSYNPSTGSCAGGVSFETANECTAFCNNLN